MNFPDKMIIDPSNNIPKSGQVPVEPGSQACLYLSSATITCGVWVILTWHLKY